jgi:hypothetical protein
VIGNARAWVVVVGAFALMVGCSAAIAGITTIGKNKTEFFANPTGGWVAGSGASVARPVADYTVGSNLTDFLRAIDAVNVAGKAGNLAVTATSSVTRANTAAAVARCIIGGGPLVCGVASAAGVAYMAYRCSKADSGLGAVCDPGQPPEEVQKWTTNCFGASKQGIVLEAAFDEACLAGIASQNGGGWTYTPPSGTNCSTDGANGYCEGVGTATYCPPEGGACNTQPQTFGGGASLGAVSQCPAVLDALNPVWSRPAGFPVSTWDGKCPTGRNNHAAQELLHLTNIVLQHAPAPSATWRDALRDALTGGQTTPANMTSTGPASQTGPGTTTTQTGAAGNQTTTKTPTYNYNYTGGNTITYTTTNVTNVTNSSGTTTTTEVAPDDSDLDKRSECEKSPDTAGCAKLDLQDGPVKPESDQNVSAVSPQSGWGADNGTCPGLVHTASIGDVDPFGLICTYMSGLRFVVIGIAWLMAGFIFLGRVD